MSDGYLSINNSATNTNLPSISLNNTCTACEGKGFIIREPGPIMTPPDLNRLNSGKEKISLDQLVKISNNLPKHIPNVTDKTHTFLCMKCAGKGISIFNF